MFTDALGLFLTFVGLSGTPIEDTCPGYYCSYNASELSCQQINNTHLDQLIIKDNPKVLEWAECQPENRTEAPTEDLIVWLGYKDNNLTEIQNQQFANYTNLNVLMLNGNQIKTLNIGSFEGLSHLEFLHLQNNEIYHIPAGIFDPLESIAWIDLSNNKINSLTDDIFHSNTRLRVLDLRNNPLTQIFFPVGNLISIDNLLLSDCKQLVNVELGVSLLNLTLENSGVNSLRISGSIRNIQTEKSELVYLDLGGASLNGLLLSDILSRSPKLEYLDLSSTSISSIDLSISNPNPEGLLPNLKFLNLSTNQIESLPMGSPLFGRNLTTLDLSHNNLENIPLNTLKKVHSLQKLYLDNNLLSSFDYRSACDQFEDLQNLTLYDNNFDDVFKSTMDKYLNQRLKKGYQGVSTVQEVQIDTKVPKDEKVPTLEGVPKDQNVQKAEAEQKYLWIWITVPIVVVLLIAVVWSVLRNRVSDCFGCHRA